MQDYRFIGQQPDIRWWESDYGRWTDFSRPTVIVEPGRFFIAGIRSKRTDSKGAGIHYALLGDIESSGGGARTKGSDIAARLSWWACNQFEIEATTNITGIGEFLDEISEENWAAAGRGEEAARKDVDRKLASLVSTIPAVKGDPSHKKWVGKPDQVGFQELARMAAKVVAGSGPKFGVAAYLNLASPGELKSLMDGHQHVVILCRGEQLSPKSDAPHSGGRSLPWPSLR